MSQHHRPLEPPFDTVVCPHCGDRVIAVFPPNRGWPRTAISVCPHCRQKLVVERMAQGRFRTRRHRGLFEGLLRL